jgi:hypothetical protein
MRARHLLLGLKPRAWDYWKRGNVMAYTFGFKWDLFISYPMEARKWAKQFQEDLQDETRLSSAQGLSVYFAPKSWELGDDSDGMLEAARSAAVFVAILTTDSLGGNASRFLRKEMEAFRESSPLKRRFCPIPLEPIDGVQLSKAMPPGSPDAFWNANLEFYYREDGIPLRFDQNSEKYHKAVQKVAYQLRKRLDEIQSGADGAPSTQSPFQSVVVYLARNPPACSTEQAWQDIRNLLVNDGVTVVPSSTSDDNNFTTDPKEPAEKADLFIQLFSPEEVQHAKAQFKVLETRASRESIPILQWRTKYKGKIDAAVLEALEVEDRKFCEGAYVHAGLLEDFKVAIRSELERIAAAKKLPPPPPPPPEQPYIYITADIPDLRLARELQKTARERAVTVIMDEDQANRREDFESNLMLASGVIFLHGTAERRFVELWLNEFVKKTRLLKLHPKVTALYEAPPEKPEEELPSPPIKLRMEGSQKEFTVAGIQKICAELCGDRV